MAKTQQQNLVQHAIMQANHLSNELVREATTKQEGVINVSKNKTHQLGNVDEREEEVPRMINIRLETPSKPNKTQIV